MASSEHLLRALIPHAVINHDATAHLGCKGWIEPVLDPPGGGGDAPCSMAARRARAGVSVAPWAESRDGFTRARLAALESSLPDADNCRALSGRVAVPTVHRQIAHIQLMSESFCFVLKPPMASSEHLLRALIPHAVINHDVTAHLGRKGWVEPVEPARDPPTGGDAAPCSMAARRARAGVSVAPWAESRDGFTRARLAALKSSLPDADNCRALSERVVVPTVHRQIAHIQLMSESFCFVLKPPMASSEHLLRALIPHAVINHDVTAHLGRKGWVEPVEPVRDPPGGGGDALCSSAARRARAGVSVAPWAESRDGFTRARLAALESSLPDADNCRALSGRVAVPTVHRQIAHIQLMSESFCFVLKPPMASSEHLLRALIPHAVINHDVTAHLGRKGWVEPVEPVRDPPGGGGDALCSSAARRARAGVSVAPWAESRDGFTRARLAALESSLPDADNCRALSERVVVPTVHRQIAHIQLMSESFCFVLKPPMASSEHLLRALIPHAVINHDVTAHLGRKGWVEPVEPVRDPPGGGGDALCSSAARRARAGVSVAPWAESRDGFTRARLAALESSLPDADNCRALSERVVVPTVHRQIAHIQLMSESFCFVLKPPMASSEHLLRALIPHAVINHDVTAHLGRKGWVEPVEPVRDPPGGGGDALCSSAARRARAGVSVAPWAESRDGFTRARLAALESSLPDADNCRALSAMAALRTALAEGLDDAAAASVAGDGTPDTSPEVLEAAVAWIRASPVRCALDLPCLSVDRVLFDEAPSAELLAALAPCVTQACFNDDLEAEDALSVLQQLPHATELILASTFVVPFMEALDRRVAENDDGAVMVAKRLRQLLFCGELARVQNPHSEEPLFPNVTTMRLGWEIESPDVWRWVSLHQAIEDLDVNYFCWCGFGDSRDVCDNSPAVAAERESAIVATLARIGPTLRKLSISVQNYVEMTTPRILASIWEHCLNVRELTLQHVNAEPGFFRDLAGLRYLRSLTLERIKGSGDKAEITDLVALPAALTQLEELRQSYWAFNIPAAFVEALAAHPQLTTWDARVRFAEHIATAESDVRSSPPPFRTLQVAKLSGSALPVVALAPNLRLLDPSGLDRCHDLQGIAFTSPYVRVDIPPTTAPTTLFAARALHDSGAFSLCGVLAPDAAFEAAGSPELAAFPPTLRHAEFASPPNFRPDPVVCALELTQLLTAARGSNLETLTLLHPPDIDVGATFGPGGFHWLRSLTVLGASQTWVDALPVLRAVCPDVVVERPDIVDHDSRRSSKYADDFFTS